MDRFDVAANCEQTQRLPDYPAHEASTWQHTDNMATSTEVYTVVLQDTRLKKALL